MNRQISDIIEGSIEFNRLKEDVKEDKLAKTILLLSKDEQYSFEFAKMLACLIFDEKLDREGDNYIKVFASSHPDLKIYPTKDKLLVGDSEEIVFESSVRPIFASKKVFIIKNIELSNENAQNKLLKTLEEPEKNVYFILTSSNADALLPTVRSRCNKIELTKASDEVLKALFKNSESSDLILALSEGNIGLANKLSQMENLEELFDSVFSIVIKMKASKEVLFYSKKVSEYYSQSSLIFKILTLAFEDILFIKSGGKAVHFKKWQEELMSVSDDYTIKAIIEITKKINFAEKEIEYNCNMPIVFENLLLNILEVKYLCR